MSTKQLFCALVEAAIDAVPIEDAMAFVDAAHELLDRAVNGMEWQVCQQLLARAKHDLSESYDAMTDRRDGAAMAWRACANGSLRATLEIIAGGKR